MSKSDKFIMKLGFVITVGMSIALTVAIMNIIECIFTLGA